MAYKGRYLCLIFGIIISITLYFNQRKNAENWRNKIHSFSVNSRSWSVKKFFKNINQTITTGKKEEQRYWKSISFSGAINLPHTNLPYNITSYSYNFWKSIKPSITCPPGFLQRLGREYDGGKWTCGINYLKNFSEVCTVYSFGISSESSFEADVLNVNENCRIFAYDPTVNGMGAPFHVPDSRVKFQKLGLDSVAGTKLRKKMQTLKFIMDQNGHDWVDILKVDIEGGEYSAFNKVFEDFDGPLPFGQLQIELHSWQSYNRIRINTTLNLIDQLQERGFRLFYYEPNEFDQVCCGEFAFINIRSLHLFLDKESISTLVK